MLPAQWSSWISLDHRGIALVSVYLWTCAALGRASSNSTKSTLPPLSSSRGPNMQPRLPRPSIGFTTWQAGFPHSAWGEGPHRPRQSNSAASEPPCTHRLASVFVLPGNHCFWAVGLMAWVFIEDTNTEHVDDSNICTGSRCFDANGISGWCETTILEEGRGRGPKLI